MSPPTLSLSIALKEVVRSQTLELIPIYWRIEPLDPSLKFTLPSESSDPLTSTEEFDFPSTLIVFSETKSLDLNNRFRKDADAYYVEAKRSMVSSVAQIPYWMYGVLVVLGWNEAMMVLFNPLYFTMMLILLVSAYVASSVVLYASFRLADNHPTLQVRDCATWHDRPCHPDHQEPWRLGVFCCYAFCLCKCSSLAGSPPSRGPSARALRTAAGDAARPRNAAPQLDVRRRAREGDQAAEGRALLSLTESRAVVDFKRDLSW